MCGRGPCVASGAAVAPWTRHAARHPPLMAAAAAVCLQPNCRRAASPRFRASSEGAKRPSSCSAADLPQRMFVRGKARQRERFMSCASPRKRRGQGVRQRKRRKRARARARRISSAGAGAAAADAVLQTHGAAAEEQQKRQRRRVPCLAAAAADGLCALSLKRLSLALRRNVFPEVSSLLSRLSLRSLCPDGRGERTAAAAAAALRGGQRRAAAAAASRAEATDDSRHAPPPLLNASPSVDQPPLLSFRALPPHARHAWKQHARCKAEGCRAPARRLRTPPRRRRECPSRLSLER
jgi:hypothetical protein